MPLMGHRQVLLCPLGSCVQVNEQKVVMDGRTELTFSYK